MRIFSALAALITAAILSVALGLSALPTASGAAPSQSRVADNAVSGPGQGVWICQYAPYLSPLCR